MHAILAKVIRIGRGFAVNLGSVAFAFVLLLSMGFAGPAAAFDASAAESLARKSGCFNCHAISRDKDAPSLSAIAEKYCNDADAQAKLHKHLISNPMVEIDGEAEPHDSLKTDDEAAVANVVRWILSL